MDLSIPYYEDLNRISNSSIGVFLKKGPLAVKELMDGKEVFQTLSVFETGTMIHEYILQPEEFWKDYIILDFDVPKVKQQKDLCDYYAKYIKTEPLEVEDTILLKAYNNAYHNKKTDSIKLEEAKTIINSFTNYIEYLKVKEDNKKVISFANLAILKKIETNLEEHVKANELLWGLSYEWECHNEFHINWECQGVQCKSLLDRVCFNFEKKKVILIDLKTTSNVYDFKHSVEEFDYYRQLAYYTMAIRWYLQNVREIDPDDFDLEVYIIAIGKDDNNQIRVFDMLDEYELNVRGKLLAKTLKTLSYHISSGNWNHSKEYYDNGGIENISES